MSPLSIVVTIAFVVLFTMFLRYVFTDPYTLQSVQDGKNSTTISANTLATNGTDVPSSNFAYSIWVYVNDWNYRYGEPKVIFGRMGAKTANGGGFMDGVNGNDPCPVAVLGPVENNISVSIGCYPGIDEKPTTPDGNTVIHTCSISNVPLQKWVHLTVSVYNRTMDLYLDGKLVRTCILPGVASINSNSDIHVTPAGGFDGWTARLQYYPYALNPQDVWNIYAKGYSDWPSLFNAYQIQLSLLQNGTTQSSVTL